MSEPLGDLTRTHTCGALRAEDVGAEAVVLGWVHRIRDLGGVAFLDIRDRAGVSQVVVRENDALMAVAKKAIERKTGARGLRSIMETILLDTMFDLPSLEGVEEVVISKEVVEGTARPLYIYADRSDRTAESGSASA